MKRLALAAVAAVAALVAVPGEASAWVSGCSASASDRYYAARCTSGNAQYVARATCYKPKVGYLTDYGNWVWPGNTSYGSCPLGYLASNPGWTQ